MRIFIWWLFVSLLASSCTFFQPTSFDTAEAIQADLAQVFTLNKEQLLARRTALLQQIELVAAVRQGSYASLPAQSKTLLEVGHNTYHFLEMVQASLLQTAKVPVAPDTTVPPAKRPYWRVYEAKLLNKKVVEDFLFQETQWAEKIVTDWQQLPKVYEQLIKQWSSNPLVHAARFPFQEHPQNQLYRWQDQTETPTALAERHFKDLPLVVVLTQLLQLETDILAQEVQLLRWLLNNSSKTYLLNDKFTVVAQSTTPIVPIGKPYQAKVNLMAYPSMGDVELRINGATVSTQGGLVEYETVPETAGEQIVAIEVLLTNPLTEEQERYTHNIVYEVLPTL